ncbi:hypothetical protein ACIBAG_28165 [Streptomyces sp. NPDC051243]|uniref:hypothetical protein n=1 Tax=Streptomyces sp. NPDC051243 TaxID=3365646 RepID=UPI0037B17AC0
MSGADVADRSRAAQVRAFCARRRTVPREPRHRHRLDQPGVFVALAVLCELVAIPAGHVGRFRGRRLDGEGRGLAWQAS